MRARTVLRLWLACVGALPCASLPAFAGQVTGLTPFTPGTPARAGEVNANFGIVAGAVNDNHTRLTAAEAEIDTKQDRVDGTCAEGSAMSAVAGDGSVTCVPLVANGSVSVAHSGFIRASHGGVDDCIPVFTVAQLFFSGSGDAGLCHSLASLTLPHGATLQSLSCRVIDSYPAGDIQVLLQRHSLTSNARDLVFETAHSVDGGGQAVVDTSAINGQVDNGAFAYDLFALFQADLIASVSFNLSMMGCTITYTAAE